MSHSEITIGSLVYLWAWHHVGCVPHGSFGKGADTRVRGGGVFGSSSQGHYASEQIVKA